MTNIVKKFYIIILALLFYSNEMSAQATPFSKGINLTNWFQVDMAHQIHFGKYNKTDFENIKSLGVDVIRLPINLHSMIVSEGNHTLDPLFLTFIDQVVDWAEDLNLHLILDNHTFDPLSSTDLNIGEILIPVWQNMAEHFKNRSNLIYYEILNEPHGIEDSTWNRIQHDVINAIREIDSIHTIIVGPAGWNSYNNFKYMPEYEDDNLIYTFHFYDPFLFTHQGASWTDPSLVPLKGVPFPYNSSEMPNLPNELLGTWIETTLKNYNVDGTISRVRTLIDIAIDFRDQRNVPIFCGEFGVYIPNSDNDDRILWYNVVRSYLEFNNISWTSWDYHGGFGIFNESGNGIFDHDLNINLLSALGFNIPLQTEFVLIPDTIGFNIYSDFISQNILDNSYGGPQLNFYSSHAKNGNYSISWLSTAQYNSIRFDFVPLKDLSYLAENNYEIGFWIKGDNSASKFDIRFIDTKKSIEDHPWRMGYTLDFTNTIFNNEWNYVSFPLSSFQEYGSWDNEWFNPQGLFDWSEVDLFEIVDEYGTLINTTLWFDDITVFDPSVTNTQNKIINAKFELFQNYPNPFNPETTIKYSIGEKSFVTLTVFDVLGKEVVQLVNEQKLPGVYSVNLNSSDMQLNRHNLSSGIYFYKFKAGAFSKVKKLLLLK